MKVAIQIVDDSGKVFAGQVELECVSSDGQTAARGKPKSGQRNSGKITCPAAIEILWKKKMLNQALTFSELNAALAQDGYTFPRNTVMMALKTAAFLTRRGSRGGYTWIQKYPFNL